MRLQNQAAIVTGSARGIGRAIAGRLAGEGAHVLIADVDGEGACRAAAQLRHDGLTAQAVPVDVTDPIRVKAMVQAAFDNFGRLDILVNNAGVGLNRPFLKTTLEEFEFTVRVNLIGAFLCSQAAAVRMAEQGAGKIISVASISGQRGAQNRSAYGASKAAVIQLTKVMALELARYGIRVNAVAPGPVVTDMTDVTHSQAIRQTYQSRIPLRRYAQCDEIAAAVAFLASDDATFITGHTLNVDGGFVSSGLIFDLDDAAGAVE
ncbi:MAG: 3-oxoacyl-ACP reductase FabG [Acidobacteria bacterium]|nr:3-oxoacyl-ACP reductase FabG [Acidobacteriota bacterium]MBI3280512.1 3-oxoacyl-ACP reductase FabG [Acidobacteriota bacterium]